MLFRFWLTAYLVADDTAAINAAISAGVRCIAGVCKGSTISPALVYIPSGYVA
jgi:glucan 1,3-beta-glucosidase